MKNGFLFNKKQNTFTGNTAGTLYHFRKKKLYIYVILIASVLIMFLIGGLFFTVSFTHKEIERFHRLRSGARSLYVSVLKIGKYSGELPNAENPGEFISRWAGGVTLFDEEWQSFRQSEKYREFSVRDIAFYEKARGIEEYWLDTRNRLYQLREELLEGSGTGGFFSPSINRELKWAAALPEASIFLELKDLVRIYLQFINEDENRLFTVLFFIIFFILVIFSCVVAALLYRLFRSREILVNNEQRFKAIMENSTDVAMIFSADRKIRFVTPSVKRFFGYSQEQILLKKIDILCHPGYPGRLYRFFEEALDHKNKTIIINNLRIRGRGDNFFSIEGEMTYLPDVSEIKGILFIFRDVTPRVAMEEERAQLLRLLKVKNEEMENIMYVSSHDLKTPLVNINGYSTELTYSISELKEILKSCKTCRKDRDNLLYLMESDIPVSLDFITTNSRKMEKLLNGLLKLSNLGRHSLVIKKVDMDDMVGNIMRLMGEHVERENTDIVIGSLPYCYGDEELLFKVFTNILDNAIKYQDPGRRGRIRMSGVYENNMSIYSIRDNGIGIAPESGERIFDIFHRLKPNSLIRGDGLGLTIVKRIVKRQNGSVWVDSVEGKGSTFYVSLPREKYKVLY